MTKGELSKKRFIETAGDLFWKNGYTKTGISEILKATGLPKGSFYFYFKKKSDVAKAVLQYYDSMIIDLLRSIAEDSDSWGAFCDTFIHAKRQKNICANAAQRRSNWRKSRRNRRSLPCYI